MAGPLVVGLMVGSSLLQMYGAKKNADASRKAGQFNARIAENNAIIQRSLAKDARKRGEINEANYRTQQGQRKSQQRVQMLAGGGSLTGSNSAILDDTDVFGELDALMIRSNSEREAWEHEVDAFNFDQQGKLARMGGENAATSALLSGGGNVASQWYQFANS